MATFPDVAIILYDNYQESFDPSVLRTEMDRGKPKQRIINSDVLMSVTATVYFRSRDDADAFWDWYKNDIGRVGEFDFTHPGTGEVISGVRFTSGNIGSLTTMGNSWYAFKRTVTMEYLA